MNDTKGQAPADPQADQPADLAGISFEDALDFEGLRCWWWWTIR